LFFVFPQTKTDDKNIKRYPVFGCGNPGHYGIKKRVRPIMVDDIEQVTIELRELM
jgi:hypothetical protein